MEDPEVVEVEDEDEEDPVVVGRVEEEAAAAAVGTDSRSAILASSCSMYSLCIHHIDQHRLVKA